MKKILYVIELKLHTYINNWKGFKNRYHLQYLKLYYYFYYYYIFLCELSTTNKIVIKKLKYLYNIWNWVSEEILESKREYVWCLYNSSAPIPYMTIDQTINNKINYYFSQIFIKGLFLFSFIKYPQLISSSFIFFIFKTISYK